MKNVSNGHFSIVISFVQQRMLHIILLAMLLALGSNISQATNAMPLQPSVTGVSRGYMTTPQELATIRQKAANGIEPYASAVADTLEIAQRSWSYIPAALTICDNADAPDWLDNNYGGQIIYAKALAYHLTGDARYAQDVTRIIQTIMTNVLEITLDEQRCRLTFSWGTPELVYSADLIEAYFYQQTCTGPTSSIVDQNTIGTGNCKVLFQNWLAKNVYHVVSLSAEDAQSNWGAAATNATAVIADYLWDRDDIFLVQRLVNEVNVDMLTPAAAYARSNQIMLDRMNGYRIDFHSSTGCDFLEGSQQSSLYEPVKSQITPDGIIPEDARRDEYCNIQVYNGVYQNYPQIHLGNNLQQCELMWRRGDTACFNNIDMTDVPAFTYQDRSGKTRTTHLRPGRGSIYRAINSVIIDSGTEWRHDEALEIAYRYYTSYRPGNDLNSWHSELNRNNSCSQDACFGTLTHGFAAGEVLNPPPMVVPPTGTSTDRETNTPVVDTTPPQITLNGANPMSLTVGNAYVEPSATAVDNIDGDLTASIITTGLVNTSVVGNYLVTYLVSDTNGNTATATRTIVVESAADTTPPQITLNGANPMSLTVGNAYVEPGATAVDNVDGDLTASIVVDSTVNTDTAGNYSVTYTVSDLSGNAASATRTVMVQLPADTTEPLVIYPLMDSYVRSNYPDHNYGRDTVIKVDASPITRSYMRFEIPTLPTNMSSVVLRIYSRSSNSTGYMIHTTTGDWDELTLTYNNAPVLMSGVLASSGSISSGTWEEIDITSLITRAGQYNFVLTTTSSSSQTLGSRDSSRDPHIIIQVANGATVTPTPSPTPTTSTPSPTPPTSTPSPTPSPTPTALPTGSGTLTLNPIADTFVQSDAPTSNFGTNTALRHDSSPAIRSFIRFEVPTLSGPIVSAKLRIYARSNNTTGFNVHLTSGEWDELSLTYNNAPAYNTSFANSGRVVSSTWIEVDVTSVVTGTGEYNFVLTSTSNTSTVYSSREHSNQPQLIIVHN